MSTGEWAGAVSVVIVAIIGLWGARLAYRANQTKNENDRQAAAQTAENQKQSNALAWSAQLVTRLEAVETDLEAVKKQLTDTQKALTAAVRFIDRLVDWGRSGGQGKMPTPPPAIHEYLDADMWGTDGATETLK